MYTEQEKLIYNQICRVLEKANVKFIRDDRVLLAHCSRRSNMVEASFIFSVNAPLETIQFNAAFMFDFPKSRVDELTIAANVYNSRSRYGRIDVDIFLPSLRLRNATSYCKRDITEEHVEDFVTSSISNMLFLVKKFELLLKQEIELEELLREFGCGGAL